MRVYLGADIYRSANALATETDFFKGKITYYTGDHKITAGYENTTYDIYNVFVVAQDGAWEFDTLADYEAGVASSFEAINAKVDNDTIARGNKKTVLKKEVLPLLSLLKIYAHINTAISIPKKSGFIAYNSTAADNPIIIL